MDIAWQYSLSYLGETKSRLCFRLCEHKLHILYQETNKSAIAKRCCENDYTFDFDSAKILYKPVPRIELDILEAFYIHENYNKSS